ncbi:MAG: caspase family protein [Candidatus Thorarchaeota archaeon]|nr:caspase family protein [Candidatus Thorarchaeota archaeon]
MRTRGIAIVFGLIMLFMITLVPTSSSVDVMPNMANRVKPMGRPATVTCTIVDPIDGATLAQGTHRILVSADSADGISKVEVSVAGATHDITTNFDGSYYFYDWTVNTDGQYTIDATATSTRKRKASYSITVQVGSNPPPSAAKWAVIIGIADYQGHDNDLWNPDEDAKEMKEILAENNYPDANIKLLLNRKATAQAILDAIDWLIANEGPNDEVVFFYSGHGFRAPDADGWDSDLEADGNDEGIVSYDLYGLPDGMLAARFANLESTHVAMIFASCHSGGMFDDNNDVGLTGTGRVLVSACKADQYGWDYLTLKNTLFFYYWGDEGLLQDNANSVESAYTYAYPKVVAEQPDSQPQIWDHYTGEFYL